MDSMVNLKTMIPDNGDSLVKREGLSKAIDRHLEGRGQLLLVSAPAGYGKSTLISEWMREKDYYKAWFTVTHSVTTPTSFFMGIVGALRRIDENICKGTENIIKMPVLPGVGSVVSSIIEEIKLLDDQLIMMIDDFQFINNDFVNQFMEQFIQFMPDNLFLIIGTREDPPLSLNRYRMDGRMKEIRAEDLRFNIEEMLELYNSIMALDMDQSDIKDILNKSEGWISGAKLVGLNLLGKDREHIHQFVRDFSGSHYYIIDYLVEEVLKDLDEEFKDFLFKISIVEKFCPQLCDYLTDRRDSARIIRKLDQMNMFLESLDPTKKWFRFHQLFRDSLHANLRPASRNDLHIKASKWFAQAELFREAVQQAILAEEYNLAVEVLADSISFYLERGEIKIFLELLDMVPDEYILESGLLLIMKAWSLFAIGRKKDALYYIEVIQKNPQLVDDKNRGRLLTLTSLAGGNSDNPFQKAKEALELIDDDDKIFKVNALMSLGQVQGNYGKLRDSVQTFQKAYYLGREVGQVFMEIMSLINLALKLNQLGQAREALTLCQQNIKRYTDNRGYLEPLARLIYIPLGILLYDRGEYQRAKAPLISGIEISEQLNLVHVAWMPKIYYAMTCFELGEIEQAEEIIEDTLEFTSIYNLKPNQIWAESIKVDFYLRLGDMALAREKKQLYKEICSEPLSIVNVKTYFTYCRILLSEGEYQEVVRYLEEIEGEGALDYLNKISLNLLLALAYYKKDCMAQAEEYLIKAFQMAGSEGYISPFVQEGRSILPLLSQFRELSPLTIDIVEEILEVHSDTAEESDVSSIDESVEPLTKREKEITELLAEGLSNKEIAANLFITEGTTKWHLNNIYTKLDVSNRTQAAAKAQNLNLID